MLIIKTKKYIKILEELDKIGKKYGIHFAESADGFFLNKKEMYDYEYKEEK